MVSLLRPFRPIARLALAAALTCGLAAPALGQTPPTPGEFKVYWAVASGNPAPGERWRDWTASIQFGEAPIHRNIQVFYEWNSGIFPAAGMHVVEMDENYMTRHMDRLRRTVAEQFPDPNAEGFGALDYEGFTPAWDFIINVPSNQGPLAHDLDIKDDWRDYVRQYRPHLLTGLTAELQEQVFAQSFNESARRFFLDTLAECKRLRPNVKWGYYLYPPRRYYDYLRADRLAAWRDRHRRELTWLYDAMDVFFPDVYSLYYTVESNPNYRIGQDSQEEAAGVHHGQRARDGGDRERAAGDRVHLAPVHGERGTVAAPDGERAEHAEPDRTAEVGGCERGGDLGQHQLGGEVRGGPTVHDDDDGSAGDGVCDGRASADASRAAPVATTCAAAGACAGQPDATSPAATGAGQPDASGPAATSAGQPDAAGTAPARTGQPDAASDE